MGSAVCRLPFFFLYNRASLKSQDGGGERVTWEDLQSKKVIQNNFI